MPAQCSRASPRCLCTACAAAAIVACAAVISWWPSSGFGWALSNCIGRIPNVDAANEATRERGARSTMAGKQQRSAKQHQRGHR
eukprot:358850-Chlamydomonas_euryale.AAC.2